MSRPKGSKNKKSIIEKISPSVHDMVITNLKLQQVKQNEHPTGKTLADIMGKRNLNDRTYKHPKS